MTFPFSALVTASGAITFTDREGTSHTIAGENPRHEEAKELLRQIAGAIVDEDEQTALIHDLVNIAKPLAALSAQTAGRLSITNGKVFFRDFDSTESIEVHNIVAERIVWMLSQGFDANPMLLFLENLMDNPSYRSVNDLYRFMERNQMGITPDGHLLAYKKICDNYTDIRTRSIDNSPGARPKMRRNEVEDNPDNVCAPGLHVCSYSYLSVYNSTRSGASDRVVVCKVNPKDVVSVPNDHADAKMRVCEYLVLKEVAKKDDLLADQAVIDDDLTSTINHGADGAEYCPRCQSVAQNGFCPICGWEEEDALDALAAEHTEEEHPPVIEYLGDGNKWRELIGHGCSTLGEAQNYVAALDPEQKTLRIGEASEASETVGGANWPNLTKEDQPVPVEQAATHIKDAAEGLFGENAKVSVQTRLDGEGGVEVKLTPGKPRVMPPDHTKDD